MHRTRTLVAIVNDDVAFVRLLDTLVRGAVGVDTLLLQVGEIAYESIRQQQPNLIILDISSAQPQVSWHALDLVMLDPATAIIPVLICSLNNNALTQRQEKLEAAGYRVIEKPFVVDELVSQVRFLLR